MATGVPSHSATGWQVEFAGKTAQLPDLKGIADIRVLLETPDSEVHRLHFALRHGDDAGSETLDEKARGAVKRRIPDLR